MPMARALKATSCETRAPSTKSRHYKFIKSNAVTRQRQGSASKAALGKSVSAKSHGPPRCRAAKRSPVLAIG